MRKDNNQSSAGLIYGRLFTGKSRSFVSAPIGNSTVSEKGRSRPKFPVRQREQQWESNTSIIASCSMDHSFRQRNPDILLIFLISVCSCLTTTSNAQTNTFPTDGNVGIGTLTPLKTLDILNTIQLFNGRNGDASIKFNGPSNQWSRIGAPYSIAVWTNGNMESGDVPQLILDPNGNLGIGITYPNQRLSVAGNGTFTGQVIATSGLRVSGSLTDITNNAPWYGVGLSNLDFNGHSPVQLAGYYGLNLKTNEGDLVMLANGNVGIGTLTPANKLSVDGDIRAKEVRVELTGWPDYVFQKKYPLTSLENLELQILQQGHLPGMPSSEEVAKKGIALGEINKKLLEKMEEMTLYMIEMKKEINRLKKQAINHNRKK